MKKTMFMGAGLAFALLFSPVQEASAKAESVKTKKVEVVAHRGAAGYAPENTIAAYDLGVKMKADFIEIDVQRTKDGELVSIHDNKVDRTTDGTGFVGDLTLEQIRSLDAGSWFNEKYKGEKVPTFEEILKRYRGKTGILIELKSPELYPGIEKQVAQTLKKYNMDKPRNGKIIIQSFNFESMKITDRLLPNIPIGVLTSARADTTDQALQAFSSYADFFNPSYSLVTEDLVNKVHSNGMKIQSWTARSKEAVQFLLDMKVDGIITDYPDYVYPKK